MYPLMYHFLSHVFYPMEPLLNIAWGKWIHGANIITGWGDILSDFTSVKTL